MPKGLETDLRDTLLLVYGHFITTDGSGYVYPRELSKKWRQNLSSSYLALLCDELKADGFVEEDAYDENEPMRVKMTRAGILEAEMEVKARGQTLDEFEADFRRTENTGRVVDTDHPSLQEADKLLEELQAHLKTDNDIGNLSPDDREVAKNEVEELRDAISKPKIRTHYLWTKAHDVLVWIMEKGAGSIVGELAKRALKPIQDFINVFFN